MHVVSKYTFGYKTKEQIEKEICTITCGGCDWGFQVWRNLVEIQYYKFCPMCGKSLGWEARYINPNFDNSIRKEQYDSTACSG